MMPCLSQWHGVVFIVAAVRKREKERVTEKEKCRTFLLAD